MEWGRQRERERERERLTCRSSCLHTHWLILVCAPTWFWTHNPGNWTALQPTKPSGRVPSILSDSLAGQSGLGCRSLLLSLWIFCVSFFWPEMCLLRKQLPVWWGLPRGYLTLCLLPLLKFFVFNLCHFNYDVSWCGPFGVHLVWVSLGFLGLCVFFSTRLEKFSVIISFNRFLIPCSLSLCFLVPLWCGCCDASCCLKGLFNSHFDIVFPFAALIGCLLPPCLPNGWVSPLLHLTVHSS